MRKCRLATGHLVPSWTRTSKTLRALFVNDRVEIRANTTVNALDMPMARTRRGVLLGLCCCVALLAGFIKSATAQAIVDPAKVYEIVYGATLDPKTGLGNVSLTLKQPRRLVRSIEFVMPKDRYLNIQPASQIKLTGIVSPGVHRRRVVCYSLILSSATKDQMALRILVLRTPGAC